MLLFLYGKADIEKAASAVEENLILQWTLLNKAGTMISGPGSGQGQLPLEDISIGPVNNGL